MAWFEVAIPAGIVTLAYWRNKSGASAWDLFLYFLAAISSGALGFRVFPVLGTWYGEVLGVLLIAFGGFSLFKIIENLWEKFG